VLSVESIDLPSIMMSDDHGEVRCCGLNNVWKGGNGCDLHGLWLVLLESAKDRFLGVDPPGQHVPPHVQYEITCLLIRDVCLSRMSGKWYGHSVKPTWCKRGVVPCTTSRNFSITMVSHTILAKPGI
jgi:hypothetical protein